MVVLSERQLARICAHCGKQGCRHFIRGARGRRMTVCPTCYCRQRRSGTLEHAHTALRTREELERASNMRVVDERTWADVGEFFGVSAATALRRVRAYWRGNGAG